MSKGMTLIEIIIGIAIISIGVVFIISTFPLGMAINQVNQRSNMANFLASSKLEEISSQSYDDLEDGFFIEDYGDIDNFNKYKRTTKIECFDPQNDTCSNDTGIKKIEVSVYFFMITEKNTNLITLVTKK